MSENTPTLKSIAENLGLSIGTVQRALHDKGGYSAETKEKVLREAKRIGYSTNAAASALRTAPITIGVVLPAPEGKNRYFFSYIWQGIEQACKDLSMYQIRLVRRNEEPGTDAFTEALEALLRQEDPIQCLITVSRQEPKTDMLLNLFPEKGIPVFIINDFQATQASHPLRFSINANQQIGHLGADIFSAIHRHTQGSLLLLGGDRKNRLQAARTADFSQRVSAACPDIIILESHLYHDLPKLHRFIQDCLEKMDDIVGLYAVSARETLTACEAIASTEGKARPTLIGTDAFAELLPYFENGILTASVYQFPTKQAYMAVHMLVEAITHSGRRTMMERFSVVPVFRSTAPVFCDRTGLI